MLVATAATAATTTSGLHSRAKRRNRGDNAAAALLVRDID
jgi:hypothetical protein